MDSKKRSTYNAYRTESENIFTDYAYTYNYSDENTTQPHSHKQTDFWGDSFTHTQHSHKDNFHQQTFNEFDAFFNFNNDGFKTNLRKQIGEDLIVDLLLCYFGRLMCSCNLWKLLMGVREMCGLKEGGGVVLVMEVGRSLALIRLNVMNAAGMDIRRVWLF